jgi:aminoglycoside 6'-N-acetyltransferase I
MIAVERIGAGDDLQELVAEINQAAWDGANDMAEYDVDSLRAYLERPDTVFVACHEIDGTARTLLGLASGRLEIKPYDTERWLYVDEVDVAVDQRRKGAGAAIMAKLFDIARAAGCVEVWLGTEVDNVAANALYGSLGPSERETFVGYAWTLDTPT